ncbi:RNB-domain-containing protein [Pilatotrama ljubarskyi]|nr:RNB-domain-containing protein [Pilatotrama ljubarskyi]
MLQDVISPEACAQLLSKSPHSVKKGRGASSKALAHPLAEPLSMEKLAFQAEEVPAEEESLGVSTDLDAYSDISQRFPSGSFVEVRRNTVRSLGVVLFTLLLNRVWTVYTLTDRGEIWPHYEHDVQFQIPNFVSKDLAEACGMFEVATSEQEMEARVEVVKRLRDFQMRLETDLHHISQRARLLKFYDMVCHPDHKTWKTVTIQEAAAVLSDGQPITPMKLLATQTYLMDNGLYFLAELRRFLTKQRFWIRPRDDVEVIQAVQKMTLEGDPALDSFAEKARAIAIAQRRRTQETANEPPSRHPARDVELTETDMQIIRFLHASLRATRHIQEDPYAVPFSQLLKKIGLYDLDIYDDTSVHRLLLDLGVLAPWQETVTRDPAPHEEPQPTIVESVISTPILPDPLGPDDFYSRDVVDHLRHDFGDMPVYVVDDWGAEELDDGVSIERIPSDPDHHWLHVHVADPSTLLPPTHRLAQEAFRMGSSRYLLDRTIPMLPRDAGFHQYSLAHHPEEPDKVMTFSAKINSAGEIVDYKVRPAVIRKARKIQYDVIDEALNLPRVETRYPFGHKPPAVQRERPVLDPATLEDLRLLEDVTKKMVYARVRAGAVTLALPQPALTVNPRPLPEELMGTSSLTPFAFRGFPDFTYGIRHTLELGARRIISECMKAGGRVASMFFRDRGIPALRRTVGPMRSERLGSVEALLATRDEEGNVDYYDSFRFLVTAPSGRYTTTPGPHSLLGVPEGEGYMKVTSPLRRFGDIFAHWQIKHALLAEAGDKASPVLFQEDWLARFGEELETRELYATRTERLQVDYWAHLFLTRWSEDAAAAQREHDPLRNLTARPLTRPQVNTRLKEQNCAVYVPELALKATLVQLAQDSGISPGDELGVRIKEIRLGERSSIDVLLR